MALKEASEIIKELKKDGYPPEVIAAELLRRNIRQGDYKVMGYFEFASDCWVTFPTKTSFYLTKESYERLKNIAKEYKLDIRETTLVHEGQDVARIDSWRIQINPFYEKAPELLEKIGSEVCEMSTEIKETKEEFKKGENIAIYSTEDFGALVLSLEDVASLWKCAEDINSFIKEKVGELKVKRSSFQIVSEAAKFVYSNRGYEVPLSQYIEAAKSTGFGVEWEISPRHVEKFDLGYLIDAFNIEDPSEVVMYRNANRIKKELSEIPESVTHIRLNYSIPFIRLYAIDTKKTEEWVNATIKELESKVPAIFAHLFATRGHRYLECPVVWLSLEKIKDGKENPSEMINEVLEVVKNYKGPTLKEDAIARLYYLINNPEISESLPPAPHLREIIEIPDCI